MQLYPLSFYEFLHAVGEEGLARVLDNKNTEMMALFHDRFTTWLKNYYFIGGMPEAVQAFAEHRDYAEVRTIQQDLLAMYEADFGKHIEPRELPRVRIIWNAIPVQLAKENRKFFFGQLKRGARAKDFEMAAQWLIDCGLIARVYRVAKPAIPLKAYLEEKGHEVINIGTDTHDSCNYPEYGEKAGRMVAAGEADGGVLICGTGVGISIAANKVKGVRAAVCSEPVTARLVKEHNNANIIAFGARIVGSETAKAIVDAWLDAKFQGGRHQTRIDMIHKIEE